MKNTLAENMRRFGTKNLVEQTPADQINKNVKSISLVISDASNRDNPDLTEVNTKSIAFPRSKQRPEAGVTAVTPDGAVTARLYQNLYAVIGNIGVLDKAYNVTAARPSIQVFRIPNWNQNADNSEGMPVTPITAQLGVFDIAKTIATIARNKNVVPQQPEDMSRAKDILISLFKESKQVGIDVSQMDQPGFDGRVQKEIQL